LKSRLEQGRIPPVRPVRARRPEPALRAIPVLELAPEPKPEPEPKRSWLEIILDPRSIQWLLAFGGALMVFGLIIYLALQGVFENPTVAAVAFGVGTLMLLLGGWALVLRTRYHMAGRALTLLACLVMPLNIWFYHYQGLMPLEAGGHLWWAAA